MKKILKKIPFLKQIHIQYNTIQYKQKFANDCYGCFYGVFDTFEDAIKLAPASKNIGYDCADLAQSYKKSMLDRHNCESSKPMIKSFDYPVLYWIEKITQNITHDNAKIFDFGGNLGIHYLNCLKYLDFPSDLKWIVCDLPAIVEIGMSENKDNQLTFTTNFEFASGSDIFLASGSIQYVIDIDIEMKLKNLKAKPKHVLINRLGLYEGKRIVTLQNGGESFYPQYIFNRSEFIKSLELTGYKLIDIWEDNVDSCYIPFHPEVNIPCYYGLYFKLNN